MAEKTLSYPQSSHTKVFPFAAKKEKGNGSEKLIQVTAE